jgi:hypothetical protein
MHMNGEISTYNVIELFRYDHNYSKKLFANFSGHLRYGNFILHKNSQNIMNKNYSTLSGLFSFFKLLCYK